MPAAKILYTRKAKTDLMNRLSRTQLCFNHFMWDTTWAFITLATHKPSSGSLTWSWCPYNKRQELFESTLFTHQDNSAGCLGAETSLTSVGTWQETRKAAASLSSCFCFWMSSALSSGNRTPGSTTQTQSLLFVVFTFEVIRNQMW